MITRVLAIIEEVAVKVCKLMMQLDLDGRLLEQAIGGHPAALLGDWRDFFDSILVLRADELGGQRVYVLELQRGDLPAVTTHVSAATGDVLRTAGVVLLPIGVGLWVENRFDDYRDVHGVRIPFRTISSNEETGRSIIQYETIETNVGIDEGLFTLRPRAGG